ncbi:hypothetical protein [Mycobacterium sp. M26]|uniref:hypothetical protein n=1 Tax=Mycobacterium sp. M26 TaxID=1762962 RepID=UPI000B1B2524|nr:hypothetical protein [Mycobacterium sp. M26]
MALDVNLGASGKAKDGELVDAAFGMDLRDMARSLSQYKRGVLTTDELCDQAVVCELYPFDTRLDDGERVTTTAELYRWLLDSEAFDHWGDGPWSREQAAAEVLVAMVLNTQIYRIGDLQLPRHPGADPGLARAFCGHWAEQLVDFIQASPGDLRTDRVGMAAARGIDHLLPTPLLYETLSISAEGPGDEFPHKLRIATTLVHRFVDKGDHARALTFASGFGTDARRLLLEMARGLHADSGRWPELMAALEAHRDQILADGDDTAVMYAAANAAAGGHAAIARSLLGMAQLDTAVPPRDTDDNYVRAWNLRGRLHVELHALASVIHYALGDRDEAVRSAQVCAHLSSRWAAGADRYEVDSWYLPKAAAWILATAEPDPASRVLMLKRGYDKYEFRGPLEARCALMAADAYIALDQPELAAYFLAQAIDHVGFRLISDHFPCPMEWDRVRGLLEVSRVSADELTAAAAGLRRLGYLPEPETGQCFWWIDEKWYRQLWSDDPGLVTPKPKRV